MNENIDNSVMNETELREEVRKWQEAAFRALGAWEPVQLEAMVQDKNDDVAFYKAQLFEANQQLLMLKERLKRIQDAENMFGGKRG